MVKFTLLYSKEVEKSRAFVALFDGHGDILSTEEECLAFWPSKSHYPMVIYEDSTGRKQAFPGKPKTWEEVQAWADYVESQIMVPPDLAVRKTALKQAIIRAFDEYADEGWPRRKSEAARLRIPPYTEVTEENYRIFLWEVSALLAEEVDLVDACTTHNQLDTLIQELRSEYGIYLKDPLSFMAS